MLFGFPAASIEFISSNNRWRVSQSSDTPGGMRFGNAFDSYLAASWMGMEALVVD